MGTLLGVCSASLWARALTRKSKLQNIPYHAGAPAQHRFQGLARLEASVVIRRLPSEVLVHRPRSSGKRKGFRPFFITVHHADIIGIGVVGVSGLLPEIMMPWPWAQRGALRTYWRSPDRIAFDG